MSTKNIRRFLVLISLVLFPQSSQAFYNTSTGRWLSRDPINEPGHGALVKSASASPILSSLEKKNLYGFVGNSAANLHDRDGRSIGTSVRLAVLIAQLAVYASDCYDRMTAAKNKAHDALKRAKEDYICCVNGVQVSMDAFPGVVSGNKSEKYGVLHCMTGFYAKQVGADTPCQAAANVLHELYEVYAFGESAPRKEGPVGWFMDTWSDMELFFAGTHVSSAEECVPGQCIKRPRTK